MLWDRQNQFVIAWFVIAGFVIAGFVVAGFVIAGFVSTYFIVILPGFQMLFVRTGSSLKRGSL